MLPLGSLLEELKRALSGERALNYVSELVRYHRIQASPGFHAAAEWVISKLEEFGLTSRLLTFPASYSTRYWAAQLFQEWEATRGVLRLVEPKDQERVLADWAECELALIQRSAPADCEAEVVLLEDGEEQEEYEGLNLQGKVVLTKGDLERVRELAVERAGAVGIIFDGLRELGVRERLDLPDARQYSSFWWSGDEPKCFGFVLTPREGERLRRLIKERAREGRPVRVHARVESRFWDGHLEVVEGLIPGEDPHHGGVLLIAHLCHPKPSANDNASGVAALLEAARALQGLIDQGKLERPRRGIRLLFVPEMSGTIAYLASHEEQERGEERGQLPRLIAGLNLDMVGEDQEKCASTLLIDRLPGAVASFVEGLVLHLRDGLAPKLKSFSGREGFPQFRWGEVPFSGGSDHQVLSDPTVGVPTVMLIQWPDRFYHTSLDTPDKVDPRMLHLAGCLAASFAYFVASAGEEEARWLAALLLYRSEGEVLGLLREGVQGALEAASDSEEVRARAGLLLRQARQLAGRGREALASLAALAELGPELAELQEELSHFAGREIERARAFIAKRGVELELDLELERPSQGRKEGSKAEEEAARLIPRRLFRGPPFQLKPWLRRLPQEERDRWWRLQKRYKDKAYILPLLGLFWADGRRSLAEIAELVELETGERALDLLRGYFELLAKAGLVELRTQTTRC